MSGCQRRGEGAVSSLSPFSEDSSSDASEQRQSGSSSTLPALVPAVSCCCCCLYRRRSGGSLSCFEATATAESAAPQAAAPPAGSGVLPLEYGVCGVCFSSDDSLLCVGDKVFLHRRGGARGAPQPPEFCVPVDCGVSVFCVTTGHRVGDALHGSLRRSISLLRPHPVSADILLVASYGGDVCLVSLAEARTLAFALAGSHLGEKAVKGGQVTCPVLKRIRLGTQCCWLEGEWGPSGFLAALVHRFGCLSFFGCGKAGSDCCDTSRFSYLCS